MSSLKDYPAGLGAPKSTFIKDVLVQYGVNKTLSRRLTLAEVNAGAELLPALPAVLWQLLDWKLTAIGGNAGGATSVDLVGTRAGSTVRPGVTLIGALTRSAVVRAGATDAAVLADGASFTTLDVNTPVSCIAVGTLTTLTHLDVSITYVATYPLG